MIDIVSLLSAFYLWAKRQSLLLLILNCLSTGFLRHIHITYGLLFGHWSHKHKLVCQFFQICEGRILCYLGT